MIVFTEPGAVTDLAVSPDHSNPNSLQVTWAAPTTSCTADKYIIGYQLTNMDQCDTTVGPKTKFGEYTDPATNITGLQAYSTYTVFVSSKNSAGSTESNKTATTAQAGKILI